MYIKDDPYASYKLLAAEFKKRHYTVDTELRAGKLFVTYTSPTGAQWATRAAMLRYPGMSEESSYISRHKEVAYKFAEVRGVAIPHTAYIGPDDEITDEFAFDLFKRYGALVVKPSNSSLSRGLTLNITTPKALRLAVAKARKVYPSVLIQRQMKGEEVRFVILNGKAVAALLRQTPRVVGDGVASVAELIRQENDARRNIKLEYVTYPQLTEEIVPAELIHGTRVPSRGEIVELNRATMIKNGCSVYDRLSEIHPMYAEVAEKLGESINAMFVVVDMFIEDYTQPLSATNYSFVEFNTAPVLKLFYGCRDGKNFDIVPKLVESIDKELHKPAGEQGQTIGSFEHIILPDFNYDPIVAKVDTGAYSGALHATGVRKKTDEAGREYLSFGLVGDKRKRYAAYDFYVRIVRSAHGQAKRRYVIRTHIKMRDRLYETDIGLADRSSMRYPMLIGRKFLRDNNILVDVRVNESMDYEKELLG